MSFSAPPLVLSNSQIVFEEHDMSHCEATFFKPQIRRSSDAQMMQY